MPAGGLCISFRTEKFFVLNKMTKICAKLIVWFSYQLTFNNSLFAVVVYRRFGEVVVPNRTLFACRLFHHSAVVRCYLPQPELARTSFHARTPSHDYSRCTPVPQRAQDIEQHTTVPARLNLDQRMVHWSRIRSSGTSSVGSLFRAPAIYRSPCNGMVRARVSVCDEMSQRC